MKKKDKMITISEKKVCIISLVLSAIYGIACSFLVSWILIEYVFQDKGVSFFNLVMLVFPFLFIALGIFSLMLLIVFNFYSKKK